MIPLYKLKKVDGKSSLTRLPDRLEVMNSVGEIKTKNAKEELKKFIELKDVIVEYFKNHR